MSLTHSRSLFFRPLLAATVLLSLAAGCTYSHGDPVVTPCDISPQTVTYDAVISPIFDAHCRECHASNKAATLGGGIDLGDYQNVDRYPAASLLASIKQLPTADPMPKGRARIPECDIRRIEAWMAAGKPEK